MEKKQYIHPRLGIRTLQCGDKFAFENGWSLYFEPEPIVMETDDPQAEYTPQAPESPEPEKPKPIPATRGRKPKKQKINE
jgi:hypothetical protein